MYTKTGKSRLTPKGIMALLGLIVIACMWINFAFIAFERASKNLKNLTHVTGVINTERYIKVLRRSTTYRRAYYQQVLVISIQGCDDEFGFIEKDKSFSDIAMVNFANHKTVADIYYDKSGKRVKQNVTLQIFDLKINGKRYISIEDINKTATTETIILSLVALVCSLPVFIVIRKMIAERRMQKKMLGVFV
jgi:hypothetical protein